MSTREEVAVGMTDVTSAVLSEPLDPEGVLFLSLASRLDIHSENPADEAFSPCCQRSAP